MAYLDSRKTLPLLEAFELALACEVPLKKPFTLLELCVYIWDIQSRPCYNVALSSVHEINMVLLEFLKKYPEKMVEVMPNMFVSYYY